MKSILGPILKKIIYNTILEVTRTIYLTDEITHMMLGNIFTKINENVENTNDYPTEILQVFEYLKTAENRNQFTP